MATLSLVNSDFVDATDLDAKYSKAESLKADLAHYGYLRPAIDGALPLSGKFNKTWPTPGNMINEGERLVSFGNALKSDK